MFKKSPSACCRNGAQSWMWKYYYIDNCSSWYVAICMVEITSSSLLSGFDHARVAYLHAAKSCSGSYLEDNEHLDSCTEVIGELATAL